jgi:hypothetical protein
MRSPSGEPDAAGWQPTARSGGSNMPRLAVPGFAWAVDLHLSWLTTRRAQWDG